MTFFNVHACINVYIHVHGTDGFTWPPKHGTIRVKCLAQGHKKLTQICGTSRARTHAGQPFMYSESDALSTAPRFPHMKLSKCLCGICCLPSLFFHQFACAFQSAWMWHSPPNQPKGPLFAQNLLKIVAISTYTVETIYDTNMAYWCLSNQRFPVYLKMASYVQCLCSTFVSSKIPTVQVAVKIIFTFVCSEQMNPFLMSMHAPGKVRQVARGPMTPILPPKSAKMFTFLHKVC